MSSQGFYKNLVAESLICARCGNCRADCPVYREIGWESASPRAKISLAREIFLSNQKEISPDYAKRIVQCTMCGACSRVCGAKIDLQSYWKDLRSKVMVAGKAPNAYSAVVDNLKNKKNISTFDNDSRLDWAEDLDEIPDNLDNALEAEIVYFVGCVSSFFPRASFIPLAMVELLEKAQVSYTTMGSQEWCCGFPALVAGAGAQIADVAKHNVEKVQSMRAKTLMTGCPSCYHVWQHIYPKILGEELPVKIIHATELLLILTESGKFKFNEVDKTITYHDPCDLGRNSGIIDAPRKIINSIPGIKFVEMAANKEDSTCCGGGGNLQGADAPLAEAIARKRIKEAEATGAQILVSACQQCEQMLEKAAKQEKSSLKIMDISELLVMSV